MAEPFVLANFLAEVQRAAEAEKAARARRARRIDPTTLRLISADAATPTPTSTAPRFVRPEDEVPRGKRAPAISGRGNTTPSAGGAGGNRPRPSSAALIAAGYDPAVVKVVSYAHGAARATATAQYTLREKAAIETHDSAILTTKEAVAAEMKDWARSFDKRRESGDVATFRLSLAGETSAERLSQAVAAGFAGHGYAYRIAQCEDGAIEARVVATMAGQTTYRGEDGEEVRKHRFHLSDRRSGDGAFSAPTRAMIASRVSQALGAPPEAVEARPMGAAGHAKAGVVDHLSRLVRGGVATDGGGALIASERQVQKTAQAWDRRLNSYTPRDTMHVVLSAKATADVEAFRRAVRSFLYDEFSNHKFAFAVHTDKAESSGHIHAHAIVAVKGQGGERLRPGPADFRGWRERFAEAAQTEGLKIAASGARERASSQSYGPRDKAIVEVAEKPRAGREARDRAYAKANPHLIEKARRRIETARTNPVKIPYTEGARRVVNESAAEWFGLAKADPSNRIAAAMAHRLSTAARAGATLHGISERISHFMKEPPVAITRERMKEDLRQMNDTIAITSASLEGGTKQQFIERAGRALHYLSVATDLQAAKERGVETLTRAELEKIAGPATERLIERASNIAAAEGQEAVRSAGLADRATEQERRDSGDISINPQSQEQIQADRVLARDATGLAARERRDADAAKLAAQQIAAHPAKPIDPNVVVDPQLAALQRQQNRTIEQAKEEEGAEQRQRPFRQR